MSKKPKLPEKATPNKSNSPPDFTLLLNQVTEIQELVRNRADQNKITPLIKDLKAPDNLSLMQLSAIPKLINTVQAAWASIVEKENYLTTGRDEMLKHLEKTTSWLNIYASR